MSSPEKYPFRQLTDPRAVRAVAHPVRLQILEELLLNDAMTATELAEQVAESPANCSWHLRQLARYGFVEEAGGGTGRKRPWRIVPQGHRWGNGHEPAELAMAGDVATNVMIDAEVSALRRWIEVRRRQPTQWQDAAYSTQAVLWLTAAELADLQQRYTAMIEPYLERISEPTRRPAGAQLVRVVSWGIPARPVPPDAGPEPSGPEPVGPEPVGPELPHAPGPEAAGQPSTPPGTTPGTTAAGSVDAMERRHA